MQKSLVDWKHHQNEELEIQQELALELWNLPWSSGTLNPGPTTLSPQTLSRLVYLCCLCSGPKNVFTHPHPQILVSNTTFQKSHLLPETHTPHILVLSCECPHNRPGRSHTSSCFHSNQTGTPFFSCAVVGGSPMHLSHL